MPGLEGLSPLGSGEPRILVLGSFPSAASLAKGQYYGHGRNHFWAVLGSCLGFDPELAYDLRIARLAAAGIALWDVLAACEREGSLDQDIRGERPNPIGAFVAARPGIERIALNGGKAASSFLAFVAPELGRRELEIGRRVEWRPPSPEGGGRAVVLCRLPSTSPVPTRDYRHARDKLPAWTSFLNS